MENLLKEAWLDIEWCDEHKKLQKEVTNNRENNIWLEAPEKSG